MEKYETCKHAISVGRTEVYVGTGCPRANMIRGTLVSSKTRCRQCLRWEGREDAENAGKGRKADPGTAESGDDAEGGAGKVRSRARRHSQNRGRERSSTG